MTACHFSDTFNDKFVPTKNTKAKTLCKIAKNISGKYVYFNTGLPFLTAVYNDLLHAVL
jgi:hypothetical protein